MRRLKTEYKGTKLEDGKGIGGAGRLTDTKIDTLQNYYGFAIRQNKGNLEGMTAAVKVKGVLSHVAATADNPSHSNTLTLSVDIERILKSTSTLMDCLELL